MDIYFTAPLMNPGAYLSFSSSSLFVSELGLVWRVLDGWSDRGQKSPLLALARLCLVGCMYVVGV